MSLTPEQINLIEMAEQNPGSLDCLVHDVADSMASNVNNEGTHRQIDYLLQSGMTHAQIKKDIEDNE